MPGPERNGYDPIIGRLGGPGGKLAGRWIADVARVNMRQMKTQLRPSVSRSYSISKRCFDFCNLFFSVTDKNFLGGSKI